MTVALCYGTRPQVIKASVVRRALARALPVLAVDTGQHYDYELNALLYEQLEVLPPDRWLDVGSGSHAEQTAAVLTRCEALFREVRPAAVVVIGDTNSTLGAALAAAKARIPVVHVEAGLRAADALMAEELNRRVVDAVAQVLCAPSAAAAARLGVERRDACIVDTGDVALDVLRRQLDRLPAPGSPPVPVGAFIFATIHRAELTDAPSLLAAVLDALGALPEPVVLAMHPRTRAALEAAGLVTASRGRLTIIPAVGYLESLALARSACAVVTDSGGLQREAYWLGTPCITLRPETEWHETVAAGANRLLSPAEAADRLPEQLRAALAAPVWDATAYGIGDAADRVAQATLDYLKRVG